MACAIGEQGSADKMAARMPGFLSRVRENNTGLDELPTLTPFRVGGQVVGRMKPAFVEKLKNFGADVFEFHGIGEHGLVGLKPGLDAGSSEVRTKAVAGQSVHMSKVTI